MSALEDAIKALGSATEPTLVPLGDEIVRVLPPMDWRQSAMDAIRAGDWNAWALRVLVNDREVVDGKVTGQDDVQLWRDADPTNRQVIEFLNAYRDAAGQAPGESQPSQS